jgi:hypothetical protein
VIALLWIEDGLIPNPVVHFGHHAGEQDQAHPQSKGQDLVSIVEHKLKTKPKESQISPDGPVQDPGTN